MRLFDVQAFIDGQRLRGVHYTVLLLCALVMFVDGFDIFMIGKIAPAIAQDFGVSPAAMTLVFLLQQIGLAVGAFFVSPLADFFGRKRMLVASSLIFGGLTLVTVFATSVMMLAILRGVAGLFLAGVLPTAVALLSEFTPRQRRSTFIAVGMTGYSLGNASGAVVALLVPDFGWESGFWIGGLMPLLLVPVLMLSLPESLAYQVNRDPRNPAVGNTIRRIDPAVTLVGDETFVVRETGGKAKIDPFDVFRDGRMRSSILIFMACTLSMGTIASLAAWLPSFFQQMAGISIQRFAMAALVGLLGGMAGMLTIGYLLDRIRPTRMIPLYYVGYGVMLILLGRVPFGSALFVPTLFMMSFFQGGGQAGLNMLMAQIYPTAIRSTGIGWAGGAGRIGGVILPLFGGLALASSFSLQLTLALVAIPPFIVAGLVLLLRPVEHGPVPAPEPVRA